LHHLLASRTIGFRPGGGFHEGGNNVKPTPLGETVQFAELALA
jgi:hypothetical protein